MPALKQPRIPVRAVVILSQYRVTGKVHLHPGQRLSDYVNGVKDFIPVTEARVYQLDGKTEINRMSLLEVNVRHVLLIYPLEGEEVPSESEDLDSLKSVYVDTYKKKTW
jgi:hypothetical protein